MVARSSALGVVFLSPDVLVLTIDAAANLVVQVACHGRSRGLGE
jgi:hypothetical protein